MFKRVSALVALVCAVPALANAWTLSTWAKSGGGSIAVTYGAGTTTQTSVKGLKFASYTTSTANPNNTVAVAVNANPGYVIYSVNGTVQPANTVTLTPTFAGPAGGQEYVIFRPTAVAVTATATAGGTVSPAAYNMLYGQVVAQKLKFICTPQTGFTATVSASPATNVTLVQPGAGVSAAYAYINKGAVMTAPIAISCTYAGTLANAGVPQTILAPTTTAVALSGTASQGATSYAWTQTSGPAVTLTGAATSAPTFVPTVTGDYVFSLAINGYVIPTSGLVSTSLVSSTVVHYVTSATAAAWNQCASCHAANNIGNGIYANWSSSIHSRSTHAICSACHFGTSTGGHPGTVTAVTVNPTTFVTTAAGVNAGGTYALAQGALFCTYCHNGAHPIPHPTTGLDSTQACASCHYTTGATVNDAHTLNASNVNASLDNCTVCHSAAGGVGGVSGVNAADVTSSAYTSCNTTNCHGSITAHTFQAPTTASCVACHDIAITHPGTVVSDNNGVRAITGPSGEFALSSKTTGSVAQTATSKGGTGSTASARSHHIVNYNGSDPDDAQCIMCHAEGTQGPNHTVVLDPKNHMADANVHLRVGNTSVITTGTPIGGVSVLLWNPASPGTAGNTNMDNFCMSCHNGGGAATAFANLSGALKAGANVQINISKGFVPSALNPFGDQISNTYDQMQRPAVVDVFDQFDTGNTSHHAVRGAKYQSKTRNDATATVNGVNVFTQYSGAVQGVLHPHKGSTTPVVWQYFGSYSTAYGSNSGPGPLTPGTRRTLYEAQLFTQAYVTLDGKVLADNVTLHCGDCHTVGQWKPGSTVNAAGQATTDVIGAHGSRNEYMLRNSSGTDALHAVAAATNSGSAVVYGTYTALGYAENITPNGNYVCFLCHRGDAYQGTKNFFTYTDPLTGATSNVMHDGIDAGQCNSYSHSSAGQVGYSNRVGALTNNLYSVFGMTCTNCHSSGNQVFGGIHGNGNYGTNYAYKTYSTNGMDIQTNVLAGANGVAGGTGTTENRNAQLNVTSRAPYRFMGGNSLKYNGGGNAAMWEKKALNGSPHREGCYNLSQTTTGVNTWSTAAEQTALNSTNYATGALNALPTVANGTDDTAASSNGTSVGNVAATQNGVSSGWGSCNHHQGSNVGGGTSPKRTVQRPLVY